MASGPSRCAAAASALEYLGGTDVLCACTSPSHKVIGTPYQEEHWGGSAAEADFPSIWHQQPGQGLVQVPLPTGVQSTPWKESYDQPRWHSKKQRHYFANKGLSSQGYGFSSGHVWM